MALCRLKSNAVQPLLPMLYPIARWSDIDNRVQPLEHGLTSKSS